MAQPKVFVSHSHVDDAFAERLVKDLHASGADAWLDKEDLGAGDFQARISEALKQCKWFVLVLTQAALESRWVQQEVHAANALKQSREILDLIFIKAGPVEVRDIPPLWRVYNIFDGLADYKTTLGRTLKAVGVAVPTALQEPAPFLDLYTPGMQEFLEANGISPASLRMFTPPLVLADVQEVGAFIRVRCPDCELEGAYAHPAAEYSQSAELWSKVSDIPLTRAISKWRCKHCQAEFWWPKELESKWWPSK